MTMQRLILLMIAHFTPGGRLLRVGQEAGGKRICAATNENDDDDDVDGRDNRLHGNGVYRFSALRPRLLSTRRYAQE